MSRLLSLLLVSMAACATAPEAVGQPSVAPEPEQADVAEPRAAESMRASPDEPTAVMPDDAVRAAIIERQTSEWEGPCRCPDDTMSNGRRCGGNSAYSRGGGARPACYPDDVSQAMIDAYRAEAGRANH